MARSLFWVIATAAVVLSILFQTASAIKCWQCSSHVSFCDDTFNANNVTEQQKGWAYKECILTDSQPNLNNQRAVCKKLKQIVHDKLVITRSCYWKNENAPSNECEENIMPQHIKTEFCETCDHEGCNGAAHYGPVTLFLAVSSIVATILSH